MTAPYTGAFNANIPIQHQVWLDNGTKDSHGNDVMSFAASVNRMAIAFYPLHRLPHHDVISADYVARIMIDFIMEVPDASVYKKNDRVIYNGLAFRVEGFPFNWGSNNPFGFDSSMFGGSVHITRVT